MKFIIRGLIFPQKSNFPIKPWTIFINSVTFQIVSFTHLISSMAFFFEESIYPRTKYIFNKIFLNYPLKRHGKSHEYFNTSN